jgi:hypothetical protein
MSDEPGMQPPNDGTRLQATREALEKERLALQAEINSYPAPIPACDVYFNDLLERRSRVCEALGKLAARPSDEPG